MTPKPGNVVSARAGNLCAAAHHRYGPPARVRRHRHPRWCPPLVDDRRDPLAPPGGELRFGFAGLDEQIVMRVDALRPPSAVGWSCVAHTRDEEWTGSQVRVRLLRTRAARVRAALPAHWDLPRGGGGGVGSLPGQPGRLRRARRGQPVRGVTGTFPPKPSPWPGRNANARAQPEGADGPRLPRASEVQGHTRLRLDRIRLRQRPCSEHESADLPSFSPEPAGHSDPAGSLLRAHRSTRSAPLSGTRVEQVRPYRSADPVRRRRGAQSHSVTSRAAQVGSPPALGARRSSFPSRDGRARSLWP